MEECAVVDDCFILEIIVIYCISVLNSILFTQECLSSSV
jgi:hypothetical protein